KDDRAVHGESPGLHKVHRRKMTTAAVRKHSLCWRNGCAKVREAHRKRWALLQQSRQQTPRSLLSAREANCGLQKRANPCKRSAGRGPGLHEKRTFSSYVAGIITES